MIIVFDLGGPLLAYALLSLRWRKPLIFRLAVELLGTMNAGTTNAAAMNAGAMSGTAAAYTLVRCRAR